MFRSVKKFALAAVITSQITSVFSDHEQIYESRVNFDVTWAEPTPPEGGALSTPTLYSFESTTSSYIEKELQAEESSGVFSGHHLLVSSANVLDQQIDVETGFFDTEQTLMHVESSLLLVYAGDESISDFHSTLTQMFTEDQRKEELLNLLKDAGVMDSETKLSSLSLSFATLEAQENDPVLEIASDGNSKSGSDKGLIVACALLSVSLVAVSLMLIWTVGDSGDSKGKRLHSSRGQALGLNPRIRRLKEHKPKEDDDDHVTNASGIIGANPNYDVENVPPPMAGQVRMTPNRGVYREDSEEMVSPLSQLTGITNVTETDASRPPLGIRSIRKLTRCMTPERRIEKNPYQMSRLSYT